MKMCGEILIYVVPLTYRYEEYFLNTLKFKISFLQNKYFLIGNFIFLESS